MNTPLPPETLFLSSLPETAIALDFETSDKYPDSACALGMVKIEGGCITNTLYTLIRPPRKRVYFTEIHGLTWNMLKNSPCFAELWPDFAGIDAPATPFLCTVSGSRKGLSLRHNRLNDVCDYLGIELDHHKADSDALACAKIYLHLREKGLTPEQMRLK